MGKQQRIGVYFLMFLVPFFWGGAFVAAEHIVTEIPPVTAAALRFLIAGFILIILLGLKRGFNWKAFKKQWVTILFMALTGIVGYNIFFFLGLQVTSSINGSLIVATTPAFMTLGAVLLLNETWNRHHGIGLILSFLGVVIVIAQGQLHILLNLHINKGDLLFLLALVCWISHGLLGKIAMRDVTPLMTTALSTFIGAIILTGIAFAERKEWERILSLSNQGWLEMSFMVVCSSVLGFLIWNYGIQQIGASQASIYMNLVPINTALLAVFVYQSPIYLSQIVGMVIVMIGVYFVTFHRYIMTKGKYEGK